MPHPELLTGLSAVAGAYDALFCDIWGVLHNGRQHFPPAYDAIRRFKAERGPVVLISNSPRPRASLIQQLASLGIHEDGFSEVISSGDATREYLRKFAAEGPAWKLGPERDNVIYDGIDIRLTTRPDEAAFISCTGLFDDENDTLDQYSHALTRAAERRLVMVCANPDKVVQRGDKIILCAGSLADLYASLGGPVIMAGKPYAPIYDLCYAAVERLTSRLDRAPIPATLISQYLPQLYPEVAGGALGTAVRELSLAAIGKALGPYSQPTLAGRA